MRLSLRFLRSALIAGVLLWTLPVQAWPTLKPAEKLPGAAKAPLMAAAWAGNRIVAVGDHGVILLSDDGGKSFRQAMNVPTRTLLTTVYFADEKRGWAAGHDGVLIRTEDGGENWQLLRHESGRERPILSLWFENRQHGIAVGLFSLAMETRDGGERWQEFKIGEQDSHLYHVFSTAKGTLLVAGEAGAIYRSANRGRSWQFRSTGEKASLWGGLSLKNGTVLICGMRGSLYQSEDDGSTWKKVATGTRESLTAMAESADGKVYVVGNSGTVLQGRVGNFKLQRLPARVSLTAVAAKEKPLFFSTQRLVR